MLSFASDYTEGACEEIGVGSSCIGKPGTSFEE